MNEREVKLAIGSLLHDVGKVVYRSGDRRNHSESGYDFLKNTVGIEDPEILNCVRYHHGKNLRGADLNADSLAYLTYFADNIASAADRREKDDPEEGFDKEVPLSCIFNILNGNHKNAHYARQLLNAESGIAFPTDENVEMDEYFYEKVRENIKDSLKGIQFNEIYINSLLTVLETNLTYIPSSTSKRELPDISLYDHVKLTAALALCMEKYFEEKRENNYKDKVINKAEETYAEKIFLLYSLDISGIQNFIYTISSEGALRGLRARSFYLDILMEDIVDELLEKTGLCRSNLIYCGGGHCYLLLPNTDKAQKETEEFEKEINRWFMEEFGTALYIAGGKASCSANDLKNNPSGSYEKLYRKISEEISYRKSQRYTWEDINYLNSKKTKGERECKICRNSDVLDEEDRCSICAALEKFSGDILYGDFFAVTRNKEDGALPLPDSKYLTAVSTEEKMKRIMAEEGYIRCYSKNKDYTGKLLSTHIWVGNYCIENAAFEDYANAAREKGAITRIGVLRADVDNLGAAFAKGFEGKYMTLSRTAVLSRQLSLFFKCYINQLLSEGTAAYLNGNKKRNAAIVYSGGDDLFIVGAWNEVIEIFTDIREQFKKFTLGSLTISGGIGIYESHFPIHIMAGETARLEDKAKNVDGKNAVCLFSPDFAFSWERFTKKVIEEKYYTLKNFFDYTKEYGMAFLYNIMELLEDCSEKINIVHLIYLLSRMEPGPESPEDEKKAYKVFSDHMYEWIKSEADRKEVLTAIYLYIYLVRNSENKGAENE